MDDKRGRLSVGVRGREPLWLPCRGNSLVFVTVVGREGSLGINTGPASSTSTSPNLTPSLTAREERSRKHP